MNIQLYFLRSSEQKIVSDMIHYAYNLNVFGKTLADFPHLDIHKNFFGLTKRDLGLYALVDNKIAGAIWARDFGDGIPVVSMAVLPEFRLQGIGSSMMSQFLLETAEVYEQINVTLFLDSPTIKFYEKFGFVTLEGSNQKSSINGADVITMTKKLEKKKVQRPSDGYDPRRWMD